VKHLQYIICSIFISLHVLCCVFGIACDVDWTSTTTPKSTALLTLAGFWRRCYKVPRSPNPHPPYTPRKPLVTHRQCDFRRAADFVVILFIELVVVFCVLFFANTLCCWPQLKVPPAKMIRFWPSLAVAPSAFRVPCSPAS